MISSIFKSRIDWSGIEIEISYQPNWLGVSAHLQISSITPERAALPITETGYRSHFLSAEEVEEAGGYVAFARAWLDHAAASQEWLAKCEAQRQYELF